MRTWACVAVAALVLAGGCGTGARRAAPPSSSPSLPSVINLGGRVLVTDRSDIRYTQDLQECVTRGRSADIARGARVEARTNLGRWTAVGELGTGHLVDGGSGPAGCAFDFTMTHAPGGSPSYRVRVARRAPQVVAAGDITHILIVIR